LNRAALAAVDPGKANYYFNPALQNLLTQGRISSPLPVIETLWICGFDMYLDIFVGVDGTGPYSDKDYETDFAKSFVKQLSQSPKFRVKEYIRGPGTDGVMTGTLATKAATSAEFCVKVAPDSMTPRVFLGGYSRGGAAVLEACHILKAKGIKVHGLLLFDAVDRSTSISNTHVPENVTVSRHAFRDPKSESRNFFGNCGTTNSLGVNATRAKFFTTHGGMGGTPWGAKQVVGGKINEMVSGRTTGQKVISLLTNAPGFVAHTVAEYGFQTNVTPEEEAKGSAAVWTWMSKELELMLAAAPKP
jgi:hypothetical protein